MSFRNISSASRWSRSVGVLLTALLLVATFRVGVDKNLVGTFTDNEWGRYLFGIGAALTHLKGGSSGYVIDNMIETKLSMGGFTASPEWLEPVGSKFPDNLHDEGLMQRALEGARDLDVPQPPPGDYARLRGSHGDDVGLVTFVTLAFLLFGIKISSLYYMFFTLLGATAILFVVSHGGSRGALASLALMVLMLYVLCLSDLVNLVQQRHPFAGSGWSDIKDPRFFGTLAVIPALHFLITWIRRDYRLGIVDYIVLAAQASILTLAIHVRWTTLWVVVAVFVFYVLAITRGGIAGLRRFAERQRSQLVFVAGVFASVIGAELVAAAIVAHPVYRLDGDLLHHPIWHNAMTALENTALENALENNAANLLKSEKLATHWNAKYLPTVNGKRRDEMPIEIARQGIAALPPDQRAPYLYAHIDHPNPEAVAFFARQRFLQILREDPWFIAKTFLIHNPAIILASAAWVYRAPFPKLGVARTLTIFVALAIIVWFAAPDPEAPVILRSLTMIAGLFSLVALLPNLLAANPVLMIDHFLWFWLFIGAAACWGGVYLVRMVPAGTLASKVFPQSPATTRFTPESLVIIVCAAALCYETTSIVRSRWNADMLFYPSPAPSHRVVNSKQPESSFPPERSR